MPKHVVDFLQSIRRLSQPRCLNHVWTHINHLVRVHFANIGHLRVLSIIGIEVRVEVIPGQFFTRERDLSLVGKPSELLKCLLSLFDFDGHRGVEIGATLRQRERLALHRLSHVGLLDQLVAYLSVLLRGLWPNLLRQKWVVGCGNLALLLMEPIVVMDGSARTHLSRKVRTRPPEHLRQPAFLVRVQLVDIDPVVVLDQDDDEVLGDDAHDVTATVHHGEGREA